MSTTAPDWDVNIYDATAYGTGDGTAETRYRMAVYDRNIGTIEPVYAAPLVIEGPLDIDDEWYNPEWFAAENVDDRFTDDDRARARAILHLATTRGGTP